MPKIVEELWYNGARERVERLGLGSLVDEIRAAVEGFPLLVQEERDKNSGAAVRKLIDAQFQKTGGWIKRVTGDLDWVKCKTVNSARVCIGVEVQCSARSDLIVVDMIHLNAAFREGRIDIGVLLVPSDRLGRFLTDRGPKISDAKRHVEVARLQRLADHRLCRGTRRTRTTVAQTAQAIAEGMKAMPARWPAG